MEREGWREREEREGEWMRVYVCVRDRAKSNILEIVLS